MLKSLKHIPLHLKCNSFFKEDDQEKKDTLLTKQPNSRKRRTSEQCFLRLTEVVSLPAGLRGSSYHVSLPYHAGPFYPTGHMLSGAKDLCPTAFKKSLVGAAEDSHVSEL